MLTRVAGVVALVATTATTTVEAHKRDKHRSRWAHKRDKHRSRCNNCQGRFMRRNPDLKDDANAIYCACRENNHNCAEKEARFGCWTKGCVKYSRDDPAGSFTCPAPPSSGTTLPTPPAKGKKGDVCATDGECESRFFCNPDNTCQKNCRPESPCGPGKYCRHDQQCASNDCDRPRASRFKGVCK